MNIEELRFLAYGPFTDKSLDLSTRRFHLIYGPNEAGKSSAMRAIDALLFGFPQQTSDNFVHRNADLRVGGVLTNDEGHELRFARRKKRKGSLISLDDTDEILKEDSLDHYLRGVEQPRFRELHCIDHDQFRAGGQLMLQLQGLAGDALLAASDNANFPFLQQQILEEVEAIYAPRKRTTRLSLSLSEFQRHKNDLKDASVSVKLWATLQEKLQELQKQKDAVVREQLEFDAERRRLDRLRNAFPKIAEWRHLQKELAKLNVGPTPNAPSGYSAEERRKCDAELESLRRALAELSDEIAVTKSSLASVQLSPLLIQNASQIDTLQHDIGTQIADISRKSELEISRQGAHRELARLCSELGMSFELDAIPRLRIRSEHKSAIQSLAADEKELRKRTARLEAEVLKTDQALVEISSQLEGSDTIQDVDPLMVQLKTADALLDAEPERQQLASKHDSLNEKIHRELTALPDWSESLKTLLTSVIPLRETINRFSKDFFQLEQQLRDASQTRARHATELDRLQQVINASLRTTSIVTEQDLVKARDIRDTHWSLLKSTLTESDITNRDRGDKLVPEFEEASQTCDVVADRLRREAALVAELAHRREQEASLQTSIQDLDDRLAKLHAKHEQMLQDWHSLWISCPLEHIRSPDEMCGWIDRRSTLLALHEASEECREQMCHHDGLVSEARKLLRQHLTEFEQTAGDGDLSLRAWVRLAKNVVQQHMNSRSYLQQLESDRRRLKNEQQSLTADLNRSRAELAEWQQRWQAAMEWIDCRADATAAQALERIRVLDDLLDRYDTWQSDGEELKRIAGREMLFRQAVETVAKSIEPDSAVEKPIEWAKSLKQRLQEARVQEETAAGRRESLEALQQKGQRLKAKIKTYEYRKQQFLKIANAESTENLAQLERTWNLMAESASIADEIRHASGGANFEEFVAQAEGSDIARLEASIEVVERELQEGDVKRDEVVAKIKEVSDEMDTIDGNDSAAVADQQAVNALSRIHDAASKFIQLKLASVILQQHVERYREQNKDPLLALASQHFAAMTGHEFLGLNVTYDDRGKAVIVGIRNDERRSEVDVQGMSDGTRDPMFLALRLAYLQRRCNQFPAMPLIVDDILIHLDDERALATLQVLADVSGQMQVLFFTHHDRIRELAASHLPQDLVAIHELERPDSRRRRSA